MLTDAQLATRRTGIGSSEIAMLTGHSTFGGPWDLYRAKIEGVQLEPTFKMELGDLLEPVVLELFRRRMGGTVLGAASASVTYRHPDFPFAVATPDALWTSATGPGGAGPSACLEAKTCDPAVAEEFGEDGTDEVRPAYLIQGVWELGVARAALRNPDLEATYFPVLFGTREFKVYRVAWDADFFAKLVGIAGDFWATHIVPKNPPPIDSSRACTLGLADRFPVNREPLLEASNDHTVLAYALKRAKAKAEEAEGEADRLSNQLREAIGEAEGLKGSDWWATWKANKAGKRSLRVKFKGEQNDE